MSSLVNSMHMEVIRLPRLQMRVRRCLPSLSQWSSLLRFPRSPRLPPHSSLAWSGGHNRCRVRPSTKIWRRLCGIIHLPRRAGRTWLPTLVHLKGPSLSTRDRCRQILRITSVVSLAITQRISTPLRTRARALPDEGWIKFISRHCMISPFLFSYNIYGLDASFPIG